jgi:hypothetical protein
MTIYIDEYLPGFVPAKWRGGGHLLASDIDELHVMAGRLGLRRSWFQDSSFPHYDCVASKRRRAIELGVTPIAAGELPDDVLMRNNDGTYEQRHVRLARRAEAAR